MTPSRAVVVGSGPNGLSAAIMLARAGLEVEVWEGSSTPGGGCRSGEVTRPGFLHDLCAAVHPLAAASPFFRSIGLEDAGVRLLVPEVAVAHPLEPPGEGRRGGQRAERAVALRGSVADTASGLGADEEAYRRLFEPLVGRAEAISTAALTPLRSLPARPGAVARFGLMALQSSERLIRRFTNEEARALVGGLAAHAMLPLDRPLTAGFALLLGLLGHTTGWPLVEGGSARLVDALLEVLDAAGGRVVTGRWLTRLDELPADAVVVLEITPRQLLSVAGDRLPSRYRRALGAFRYGPGVCKVDWALAGPVPWRAEVCRKAGTVHVGGDFEELVLSEDAVASGRHPERPYCIIVQPSLVDHTRAPGGAHTLWGYCHVPSGSTVDMAAAIEAQIERFAPGFCDLVLQRSVRTAAALERDDPNYVGGDINCGASTLGQMLCRPVRAWNPYRLPVPGLYLCSASTPPGGGVHGMCGVGAAKVVLADLGIGGGCEQLSHPRSIPQINTER